MLRRLFVTPWTVACQTPPSVGFFRQEYWSGLLSPSPGDLPEPGIEPVSPALTGGFFTAEPPGKPMKNYRKVDGCSCGHTAEEQDSKTKLGLLFFKPHALHDVDTVCVM